MTVGSTSLGEICQPKIHPFSPFTSSAKIDALKKDLRCNNLTLSRLDPLVSLWLLVPLVCRFYFGPDIRSAHGRIPGKLCRERYGSQAGRFVSLSGPDKSTIHTGRITQACLYLTPCVACIGRRDSSGTEKSRSRISHTEESPS
jgi:hypothetical protein